MVAPRAEAWLCSASGWQLTGNMLTILTTAIETSIVHVRTRSQSVDIVRCMSAILIDWSETECNAIIINIYVLIDVLWPVLTLARA